MIPTNSMILEPQCITRHCVHFIGVIGEEPNQTCICKAYPGGIPREIAYESVHHFSTYSNCLWYREKRV